jgi:hypothetical protein
LSGQMNEIASVTGRGTNEEVRHPNIHGRVAPELAILAFPEYAYAVPSQTAMPEIRPTIGEMIAAAFAWPHQRRAKQVVNVPGLEV